MVDNLASRLINYRTRNGMTQQQVAEIIGVTPSQVSRYEDGSAEPRKAVLRAIVNMLNEGAGDLSLDRAKGRGVLLMLDDDLTLKLEELAASKGISINDATLEALHRYFAVPSAKHNDLRPLVEKAIPGGYDKLVKLLTSD